MTARNRNPWQTFLELVKRATSHLYPGIGVQDRMVYGRILSVSQTGGLVTKAQKLWSVDIEVLTPNLDPDGGFPVVKDVPLDPTEIGEGGQALFPLAFPGLIVRMGWMYGNRAYPYIHSFTAEGLLIPSGDQGELVSLLKEIIQLLMRERQSAVGPAPYDLAILAQLQLLLLRIP